MIDIGSSYSAGITRSARFKMKTQNNADGMALWKAIFWEGIFASAAFNGIFVCFFWLVELCLTPDFFSLPVCYILGLSLHLASLHTKLWRSGLVKT